VNGSRTSLTGWLARMGFADTTRAEGQLADLGITGDEPLLAALAQAADPELALTGLSRIAERSGDDGVLHETLNADRPFRERLTAVLGVSKELAEHLARHPSDCAVLRGPDAARRPGPEAIRAELLAAVGDAGNDDTDPAARLAAAYRRRVLHLAGRDLTGEATLDEAAEELSDIASAVRSRPARCSTRRR
jgi:[glutamine synthetase] adenylyltransferase / [glutamine synthetase]-adenylyl-L-tyrosine phosphorylase